MSSLSGIKGDAVQQKFKRESKTAQRERLSGVGSEDAAQLQRAQGVRVHTTAFQLSAKPHLTFDIVVYNESFPDQFISQLQCAL